MCKFVISKVKINLPRLSVVVNLTEKVSNWRKVWVPFLAKVYVNFLFAGFLVASGGIFTVPGLIVLIFSQFCISFKKKLTLSIAKLLVTKLWSLLQNFQGSKLLLSRSSGTPEFCKIFVLAWTWAFKFLVVEHVL